MLIKQSRLGELFLLIKGHIAKIDATKNESSHISGYQIDLLSGHFEFNFLDFSHYENTPMQYTAIFHGCKNDNFQMKNSDVFLIFAQNIDCGYTLEPPQ